MRLGFIINPVAGMGGKVGLKGTDGDALSLAVTKGAVPLAPAKAREALGELLALKDRLTVLAAPGAMGAALAEAMGFTTVALGRDAAPRGVGATSRRDTRAAAAAIRKAGADLVLFVGGDGTARDMLTAWTRETPGREARDGPPVLGAPAGVKMHSGVFAVSPRTAGALARRFLTATGRQAMLRAVDIVDRPETENGGYSEPRVYGAMRAPCAPLATAPPKAAGRFDADDAVDGASLALKDRARRGEALIIGPGAAMQAVKRRLGDPGTLLGVDVFKNGRLIVRDADSAALMAVAVAGPACILVSPTGGQGFLFGRGNQQIDADVINTVGARNVIVAAAAEKLLTLETGALFVDTGDAALNAALSGYIRVITAPKRRMMFRIVDPDAQLAAH